jgi:hypothetical protein
MEEKTRFKTAFMAQGFRIYNTVGAQSIARAQSIAHGHNGDVICQKNENL